MKAATLHRAVAEFVESCRGPRPDKRLVDIHPIDWLDLSDEIEEFSNGNTERMLGDDAQYDLHFSCDMLAVWCGR